MRLSVIVSTYNQPDWLELVLRGLSVQTCGDFELIVADDGSDERTADVLERLRSSTSLAPLHVWHEDRGFRKCRILNRAIQQAGGDYLIFLDGDCIPRADFVDQHRSLARTRRFLSGGAIRLPEDVSHRITVENVIRGEVHQIRWLRDQKAIGVADVLKLLETSAAVDSAAPTHRYRVGRLLDRITPTRPTFNGGNVSLWRRDILRTGGFDERMGHGGLDREVGERLTNAGIRGKQVRHRCICLHLHHTRAYASPAVKAINERIRLQTRQSYATTTAYGIDRAA